MATAAPRPCDYSKPRKTAAGRRYDHFFFSGMALLMLATVFVGFARTYYLAGIFHAPLPSRIIHVHGAAFSCWILLLVTQTSLVAAGRVDIHRRLGIAGFILGCLMVVLGVWAATDSLVRHGASPVGDADFYAAGLSAMLIFATLIFFAFRARFSPPAHKRLIFLATVVLLVAAIIRWPFPMFQDLEASNRFSYVFLLMLVVYDLWSLRKVHRATLWAGGFLIFMGQTALVVGRTATWHAFDGWVQSLAH